MNTVALESTRGSDRSHEHVRKSILNFGFPGYRASHDRRDLGRRREGRDRDRPDELRAAARTASRSRSTRDTRVDAAELKVRFIVRADLAASRSTFRSNSSPTSRSTAARSRSTGSSQMDREFLDLYNRELQLLHEQAGEFADEYPGIAERLGGLVARTHRPDGRGPAGRRRVPRRPRAAQAQARDSRNSPAICSSSWCRTIWRRRPRRCWPRSCRPIADPALRDGQAASRAAPISTPPTASATAASPAAIG